jgi:folate-binding protein YgfZ
MKIFKLNKRAILFKNNAEQFLNGLSSNAMDAPRNAFVNIHGMIVATFDQLKLNSEEVIAIFEEAYVDAALQHVERFMKISGVIAENLDRNLYFDAEEDVELQPDDLVIEPPMGQIIITKRQLAANMSEEEFSLFRLKHFMPVQGIDFKDDFILNIGDKEYVSFSKGCYLGQEPVAKVHNRSKPTWKLVVKTEEDCTAEEKQKMTSKTFDKNTGKTLGFVFVRNV